MSSKSLDTIISLLLELASGNLDAKGTISPRNDDYDAIINGINILTEELKQTTVSKDYLNSIYKGIADLLFILDEEENISEINSAAATLLKLKPKLIIGKPFKNLFLDAPSLHSSFIKLKKEGYCYEIENTIFDGDGKVIPVSCTASALYDKKGGLMGYVFIAKDISKIKKTEEELKLKNKELDTFLYKAAHDLKSPVSSIQGLLNIAQMEIQDSASLKYFDLIRQCAYKLDKILSTLKDTVEADIRSSTSEPINLKELIEECLDQIKSSNYYNPNTTITKNIHQIYTTNTKRKSLQYILYQLLENAYKFQSEDVKNKISIHIRQNKYTTTIAISDKGVGIHKKYQDKIFDMFYKANTSFEGAGLGLYSAQSVLAKIGGEIKVSSKYKLGSTFTISFPNTYYEARLA